HQPERREQLSSHYSRQETRRMKRIVAGVVVATFVATSAALGQFGGRGRGRFARVRLRTPAESPYDGAFRFCRIMFRNSPDGDGNGWSVDYPRADQNLTFRFSELTKAIVSRDVVGDYNHLVITLTDPELYRCPFIMMTEPGGA